MKFLLSVAIKSIILNVIMVNVLMLSAIMLSVVATLVTPQNDDFLLLLIEYMYAEC